ncbi:hypothetical protein BDV35DRAFT_379453 [Aspergillus flavus]|uniref:Uncharacterized protein n=1 Tax=Aspergillus flavus TaxID=5059 RepID=A0A5N6GZZ4_ASPFL|nr:hypothetical protein BDV35DRAFT_379453 [Aspergillus flavus]
MPSAHKLVFRKQPRVIGSLERNEAQKTGWPQQQKTLQSGKLPPAYAVLINGMDIKLVYQVKGDEAKVHTVANQMGQMQMLWTPPKSSLSTGEKGSLVARKLRSKQHSVFNTNLHQLWDNYSTLMNPDVSPKWLETISIRVSEVQLWNGLRLNAHNLRRLVDAILHLKKAGYTTTVMIVNI